MVKREYPQWRVLLLLSSKKESGRFIGVTMKRD
jgi:hypothetical protein